MRKLLTALLVFALSACYAQTKPIKWAFANLDSTAAFYITEYGKDTVPCQSILYVDVNNVIRTKTCQYVYRTEYGHSYEWWDCNRRKLLFFLVRLRNNGSWISLR